MNSPLSPAQLYELVYAATDDKQLALEAESKLHLQIMEQSR